MKMKTENYYVYILTNYTNNVLYIGMTSNLPKRIWEHKQKLVKGFTEKYNVNKLVYFETLQDPNEAAKRERNMKEWKREWKIKRIKDMNPNWTDLYEDICN